MRQVVIYPGEDGQWVAECPSLPGCVTQGHTREEAVANARDAISEYIAHWRRTAPRSQRVIDTLVVPSGFR